MTAQFSIAPFSFLGVDLAMRDFDEIYEIAAQRYGGAAALAAHLTVPLSAGELYQIGDDRLLSAFAAGIFSTGLSWRMVEKKWPGIEDAFHGFDLNWCANIADERLDSLLADSRIIRHHAKVEAIARNADWLRQLAAEHGSAMRFFTDWPKAEFGDLLLLMKSDGARLGGSVGAYALRRLGVDGFILSNDVTARLIAEGVIDKAPTSKSAMRAVQAAFAEWMAQSGRSLSEISQVLARSL